MAPPSVSCPSGHSPGRRRTTRCLDSCRRKVSGAETAQELIEQIGLALRRHPVGVEYSLGADPVDQRDELMSNQIQVDVLANLAELGCLVEVGAQSFPEPVELAVLQIPQGGVAKRRAPETDLDLPLDVADLLQRQCLEHDDPQCVQPPAASG